MSESFSISEFDIPPILSQIADPPKKLYLRGEFPSAENKFLTVVGSRKYTSYGKSVCESLIAGLKDYPVVIVSGLALGIDGIAHKSALGTGLKTLAVPGSGLSDKVLYPATHRVLAKEILEAGGALLSEFEPEWRPRPESFPQRNRIMAGLSDAVLVIEAEKRSGTLITSRLATEYNRDVLTVPGSIYSDTSVGPHMLIQRGAGLVTSSDDILDALGINKENAKQKSIAFDLSENEKKVKEILSEPMPREDLVLKIGLSVSEVNVLLSALELKGYIKESMGLVEWVV